MINFSVIIPHFTKNDTQLLQRAINSIPDRTDIEVLVVDNSPKSIKSDLFPNRENVQILFSDSTKGAGHARNIGIDASIGEWLLFLDADDFFTKSAFKTFNNYLKADKDIIFFKMTSCYSDTLELADRHKSYSEFISNYLENKNEHFLRFQFSVPWSKMVKSDLVKKNNISFDVVPAANDVIFALKVGLLANSIAAEPTEVYCVTVRKGSITRTKSLKNIESQFNVRIRKNQILKENGIKKNASIMYILLQSRKYGFITFLNFLLKAILTRNLFVGSQNWVSTIKKSKSLDNKKN